MAESCVLSPISASAIMLNVEMNGLSTRGFSSPSHSSFDNSIQIPKTTNIIPAIIFIISSGIIFNNPSPTNTPRPVTRTKARTTPENTFVRSYFVDNAITVSCVLSPSSARAIRANVEMRGVSSINLLSVVILFFLLVHLLVKSVLISIFPESFQVHSVLLRFYQEHQVLKGVHCSQALSKHQYSFRDFQYR